MTNGLKVHLLWQLLHHHEDELSNKTCVVMIFEIGFATKEYKMFFSMHFIL